MLILRNKLTKEKWEVLDTDDNTVEVATEKELIHYVQDLGINIQGVVAPRGENPVFIPQFNYSVKETKLHIRRGIKLHVENGILRYFELSQNLGDITINLSDWCTSLAPYCFRNESIVENTKVRLLFDNNIDFKATSVVNLFSSGSIIVDIRNVNNKKASYIYKQAIKNKVLGVCMNSYTLSLIDDEDRLRYYQSEVLLRFGMPTSKNCRAVCEETLVRTKVIAEVASRYKSAFEQLEYIPIMLNKSAQLKQAHSMHIVKVMLGSEAKPDGVFSAVNYLNLDSDLIAKLYHACFDFHLIGYLKYWNAIRSNIIKFSENYTNSL